jgi:hypothetical protein
MKRAGKLEEGRRMVECQTPKMLLYFSAPILQLLIVQKSILIQSKLRRINLCIRILYLALR